MADYTFYTQPMSRGQIARWALHEAGADYQHQLVDLSAKPPELLAVNPMGKVPVIVHHAPRGDRTVTECGAICAYLAEVNPDADLLPYDDETADYFRRLHEAHGVRILEGTGLAQLTGEDAVTGAILVDGTEIPADLVIVGIGILPNAELAEAAGIALENGIRTDELGRTSAPHVWAAGDCASFPQGDARIRLESVGNAIDMADTVAANILGAATPYQAKPWFWSDQYDVKLQIAGLNTGYDRIVTREGEGGAVSFWYYRGATLLALDAMNDARAYMIGKRLIEAGRSPDPTLIADPAADLKALLR